MFANGCVWVGEFPLLIFGVTAQKVDGVHHLLQGDMAEQVRHRLSVVSSADGLGEDHGDVDDLEAGRITSSLPACDVKLLLYTTTSCRPLTCILGQCFIFSS